MTKALYKFSFISVQDISLLPFAGHVFSFFSEKDLQVSNDNKMGRSGREKIEFLLKSVRLENDCPSIEQKAITQMLFQLLLFLIALVSIDVKYPLFNSRQSGNASFSSIE